MHGRSASGTFFDCGVGVGGGGDEPLSFLALAVTAAASGLALAEVGVEEDEDDDGVGGGLEIPGRVGKVNVFIEILHTSLFQRNRVALSTYMILEIIANHLSLPGDVGIGDGRGIECGRDRWRCNAGKSANESESGPKCFDEYKSKLRDTNG